MKVKKNLKQTLKIVKDLILFDSAWNKRNKIKHIDKKAISKLETYRNLVRTSLFDLINNIYPNTCKAIGKKLDNLLPKYIEKYPPSSPILIKAAEYFPQFLQTEKSIMKKYPFISELALYEWLEVDVYEREEDKEVGRHKNKGKNNLVLNPVHEMCTFQYAVPEICENIEDGRKLGKIKKSPTNVFIYRDPKNLSVRFMELSLGTLNFIELLKSGFPTDMVAMLLANHYNIDENNLQHFYSEINKLVKTLIKSRILIQ
ncbi:MAG: putative DNA-binding domain-containing protein [Candidatus Melainabacteria bacterium]|nr:putative DNA-binding domain-containing protein [Candidatus Melainabacteria bacterium]